MPPSPFYTRALLTLILLGLVVFSFNPFLDRNDLLPLYDSKRLFVIVVIQILTVALFFSGKLRQRVVEHGLSLSWPNQILIVTLVMFTLMATWLARYPLAATLQWFYLSSLVLLIFVLRDTVSHRQARLFEYALWLSMLLFLSIAIAFWIRITHHLSVNNFTLFGFANPRFLNQIHIWLIFPVVYLAALAMKRGKLGIVPRAILTIDFTICFATDARGPLVAILGGFILLMLCAKELRDIWWKLLWQSAVAGAVVKLALLSPLPSMIFGGPIEWLNIRTDSPGRLALWQHAWQIFTFSGLGGDAFVCEDALFGRPHSSILNVLVHWGVVATLCYLGLILSLLRLTITQSHLRTKLLGVSVLSGIAYSFVSGVLDSPLSQLMAVLSTAMFWSRLKERSPRKPQRVNFRFMAHCLILVVSLGAGISVTFRALERLENYPVYRSEQLFKTQFWLGYNCLAKPWQP
ncbi:O-antigen ligase family protein [Vibrio vulnificus]